MEEQKLMQLIAEMIQAKVTPQEMIGKLTQLGLSEEQAISAVKMVASKLNGGQEQPEKMEDGAAIQPAGGYVFNEQSAKLGGNGGLYEEAVRSGYYGATKDAQGNWTVQGAKSVLPVQIRGNQAYVNNRPQPWLNKVIANSGKPNLNMQVPAPQLLAGSGQPAKPLMENGGNLQFYKKGGKMAPAKPGKKEKKCSCGCKMVLKKVGGKITEQCSCGCKVKK